MGKQGACFYFSFSSRYIANLSFQEQAVLQKLSLSYEIIVQQKF